MLPGAFPAGLVELGRRCLLELRDGVGGGAEGLLPDRVAEGPVADDSGVDTLPEQGGDNTADDLETVDGYQISLHDPMPSHPQLRTES